ncbi:MAG: DUF6261 family protein [Prevotellaceae bacterium]|nr:DUF6261 family protein [Prevotellaceae bacterium]
MDIKQLIEGDTVIKGIVADLLPPFYDLITVEGSLVDAMRGSQYTEELSEADKRRDRCLVGINSSIEAGLHHFDPAVVQAAHSIKMRIKAFRGEIESKPYLEEAAAIAILLNDFGSSLATAVTTVGISAWVTELAAAQQQFNTIFQLRSNEFSQRPQGKLEEVRKELNAMYRTITNRIDAYNIVNADSYNAFIRQMDEYVDYFNEHSSRKIKKDISKSDHTVVEPIPTQTYTGESIIIIPTVYYREEDMPAEKLELGKDFTVSYKNNINIGMAYVSIYGKGLYKGRVTVTFDIVAPLTPPNK